MYNVLKDLKQVFITLDAEGIKHEVPKWRFVAEIKRETGVFNEKTLSKWMKNFVEMGYIKIPNQNIIQRCKDFDYPYVFTDGKEINEPATNIAPTPDKITRDQIKKEADEKIRSLKGARTKIEV